jgi:ribosomal protein S18 acetylase RimI-like enzyme
MSGVPGARRATGADVQTLARALARAFLDDPVAMWAFDHDDLRPGALERFQATRLRQLLGEEEVWMSEDHACAALWAPPGRWRTTVRQDAALLRSFTHPRLLSRLPLVALGLLDIERKHPHEPPHYYLAMLGTDPDHQGQGLGSALMRPILERCDVDGVGAFLESSKERNIDFYARHGFRVVQEIRLPRGPRMWQMWRDPL